MVTMATARYKFPGMYVYEGAMMSAVFPKHKVEEAKVYNFSPEDVIVSTYPKSGTTWMQEVAWLLLNNCDFEKAKTTLLDDRCLFLEQEKPSQPKKTINLKSPKVIKTHLMQNIVNDAIDEHRPRALVVLRNPKDVLVSQFHFYQMNQGLGSYSGTWEEFFEMFKNKELQFGYWYDHVKGWWQQHTKPNYHFITYEDMKKQPLETLAGVANFLKVSISEEQLQQVIQHTNFDKMKTNDMVNKQNWKLFDLNVSKFMRKGVVGDWKNYFSQEQNDFVDKLCDDLKDQGLIFDFE